MTRYARPYRSKPPAAYSVPSRVVVAIGLAALAMIWWRLSGSRVATQNTLADMGFDPGRAYLLGALIIGAVVASVVAMAVARNGMAVARNGMSVGLGFVAVLIDDAGAFLHDTAVTQRTPGVAFDAAGWILTGLAIAAGALVIAWSATTLTLPVRAWLIRAGADGAQLRRDRKFTRRAAVPTAVAIVAVAAIVLGPVLGDLLNYGTDARMADAGTSNVALFGGGTKPTASDSQAPDPRAASTDGATSTATGGTSSHGAPPAGLVAGPLPGTYLSSGALSSGSPWASSAPSGTGRSYGVTMPAFWSGGAGHNEVDVYLPPGYDANKSKRYPVIYELPYEISVWQSSTKIKDILDSLITKGKMPAEIVLFVWAQSPPYRDTECANSFDGKEWFDKFIVDTVVPWADKTFRTIPTAAARATMGSSKGGYCAATVATHHPDVFGSAISFSGYFTAGLQNAQTVGADLVFGKNTAYMHSQSPINVAPTIPSSLASKMFFVLVFKPDQDPFGPQALAFSAVLLKAGIPQALMYAPLGHSWTTDRDAMPTAFLLLAERQAQLGVFGTGG
jgi:enterochelin esterase-like enzyme